MSTHGLFSVPVGEYKLDREFSTNEKTAIDLCLQDLVSNIGNKFSKNTFVLNVPELCEIRNFCEESVKHFNNEINNNTKTKLRITQSWLNISKANQFHHKHRHPNSYISGVLYIETSENDRINFYNPATRFSFYQETPTTFNQFNSSVWWLPATQGMLYLFPSDLEHEVPPVLSNKRISLSFNTFFDSDFGDEMFLTYLPFGEKKHAFT